MSRNLSNVCGATGTTSTESQCTYKKGKNYASANKNKPFHRLTVGSCWFECRRLVLTPPIINKELSMQTL